MSLHERCPNCPGTNRTVPGNGPLPCSIMFIGEAPGELEEKRGIPLIGQAGMELNDTYLNLAGLHRDDIYVTNAVKCRQEKGKTPNESLVVSCASCHLPDEILECAPDLIILSGGTACSLLPKLNLEVEHGIPQYVSDVEEWAIPLPYTGWIVPMYHPALGLHDTAKMHPMLADWANLKRFFNEGWAGEEDEFEGRASYWLGEGAAVGRYLSDPDRFRRLYNIAGMDTEHLSGVAYSVQVSLSPGTGLMVMADDEKGIEYLKFWLTCALTGGWKIALHNAPQDMDTLAQMGIEIPIENLLDTMQEAFHLAQPQALKTLGYRLCGVRMQQYEDLVIPYSKSALLDWMEKAIEYCQENLKVVTYKQLVTKLKIIEKPCGLEQDLKRIHKHTCKGTEYKSWDKLAESMADPENAREVEDLMLFFGPYPTPGLNHVPKQKQVTYACTDADITLRVALKLQKLRDELPEIAEGDIDNA